MNIIKQMNAYYIKDYIVTGGVILETKQEQSSFTDKFSNKLCSLQKDYVQELAEQKDHNAIKNKIKKKIKNKKKIDKNIDKDIDNKKINYMLKRLLH